ncbi:MAG: restriction endonuclease subunit S [Vibrio sp.]
MIKLGCNTSLPSGWQWAEAGKVIDIRDGTHDSPKPVEVGIPLVTSKNLKNGKIDFSTCTNISAEDHEQISKRSAVDDGDILYAMIGTIGNPVIVQGDRNFSIKNVALFKFSKSQVFNRFFYHLLGSSLVTQQFEKNARGGTQKFVSLGNIRALQIPLPPLAEQKRIAAILDKADAIRQKRQQAIKLADEFLRSVFLEMFGDPVTNPKGWEVCELSSCLDFLTSGSRGWAKYYVEEGSKFIRIQNVGKNKLLLNELAYVNAPDTKEAERTRVKVNDVLLSITADLGRSAVVTEEWSGGHINQHLALLRLKTSKLEPQFLSALLSSEGALKQFKAKNKAAVKAGLNFDDIRTFEVYLPPLRTQSKYLAIYNTAMKNLNKLMIHHDNTEVLFSSLSQKAFSGQL